MRPSEIRELLDLSVPELVQAAGEDYVTKICENAISLKGAKTDARRRGGFDFDISDVLQTLANLAAVIALALEFVELYKTKNSSVPTNNQVKSELQLDQDLKLSELPEETVDKLIEEVVRRSRSNNE